MMKGYVKSNQTGRQAGCSQTCRTFQSSLNLKTDTKSVGINKNFIPKFEVNMDYIKGPYPFFYFYST